MAGAPHVRFLVTVVTLGVLVLACSPAASSPSGASPQVASGAPSQAPAASPGASGVGIVLQRTGPIGCDAIGVDYTSATIKIDAAADPDVWAETNVERRIAVSWTDGFTATDGSPPVVNGPKGEEVARDGTRIDVPAAANPRLAGYFVCLAPDAVYILESDPQ